MKSAERKPEARLVRPVSPRAAANVAALLYALSLTAAFALFVLFISGRLGATVHTAYLVVVAGLRYIAPRLYGLSGIPSFGVPMLRQTLAHAGALFFTEWGSKKAIAFFPDPPPWLLVIGTWILFWPLLAIVWPWLSIFLPGAPEPQGRGPLVVRGKPLSSVSEVARRLGARTRS